MDKNTDQKTREEAEKIIAIMEEDNLTIYEADIVFKRIQTFMGYNDKEYRKIQKN